jgi:hypothetical protein
MNESLVRQLKRKPLVSVMVRIPTEVREKIKQIIQSSEGELTEADILRTAVISFVAENPTNSREDE